MNTFLGLRLDPLTMKESIEECEKLIAQRGHQHVVLNASKVVMAADDIQLTKIINECSLVNADGMSIVWASTILGSPIPERVTGVDLMNQLLDLSRIKKYTVFLLGAEDWVVRKVNSAFIDHGIKVVGFHSGFWDEREENKIVEYVASTRPDLLFVALPSPTKEKFLAKWLGYLNVGLAVGVGGSFDVIAGKTKRAPKLFQITGLEWLYRLAQEPRRLLKRYLIGNSRFIGMVIKSLLSKSKAQNIE